MVMFAQSSWHSSACVRAHTCASACYQNKTLLDICFDTFHLSCTLTNATNLTHGDETRVHKEDTANSASDSNTTPTLSDSGAVGPLASLMRRLESLRLQVPLP
jgi:hypothetical protein